jgi:hypothetical protein
MMTVSMTVAAGTTVVAQSQTMTDLVGTMVAQVPTLIMVLTMVAALRAFMIALAPIMVAHHSAQTTVVPMVNDPKGVTGQAAASEDPKGTVARVAT